MHLHAYVLPILSYTLSSVECFMLIIAGFGNRASDRGDPSLPRAQRKERFVLGSQAGHVACAKEM
jgi:hypothetical protein